MATVNFYLKRAKDATGELKKDHVQVYLKFTIDRSNRFDLPTGEKIIPKYWDNKKQVAKSSMLKHLEFNQNLGRIRDLIIQYYRDNKSVSIDTIQEMSRNLIKHGQAVLPTEKKSLIYVLDLFIAQYAKEKDSKTVAKYSALREKLKAFNLKLSIEYLDFNFYDAFKAFLYSCPNPNYRGYTLHLCSSGDGYEIRLSDSGQTIGLFDDVVYKYFTNLKTVLTWATKRGFQPNLSFKTWEIIHRKYPPITLTMAELEKLESLEITAELIRANMEFKLDTPERRRVYQNITNKIPERSAPILNLCRDYLAIECRTGQRISDIKRFDPKDLHEFKWTLTPKKGNRVSSKKVTVHFKGYCAPALWIFQRHNHKLPSISEQKLNINIKKIAKLAGIDQEVTIYRWAGNKRIKITGPKYEFLSTHTGRKTFITLALQSMPPKLVKDLAGIDSYATLKHYEGESEDATIEKYLTEMQEKTLMKKVI